MLSESLVMRLLHLDASGVRDTFEGGMVAHRAVIPLIEIYKAQKFRAVDGWNWANHKFVRLRYEPPWSEDKREVFRRRWLAGATHREMEIRFRLHGTVNGARKRLGLPSNFQIRRWQEWEDELLRNLAWQGTSVEEIARYLKRPVGGIKARAVKLGIKDFTRARLWDGEVRAI